MKYLIKIADGIINEITNILDNILNYLDKKE